MSVRVTLLYFAALRDAAGIERETLDTAHPTLQALYEDARARHGLPFAPAALRVAVGDAFARWDDAPRNGDQVAFIPPVSGG